jgi:NADH-ubiquinone oxidoreductase chain 4
MYNRISYGSFSPYLVTMPDLTRAEFHLLLTLLIPTLLLGIFPDVILETLNVSVTSLLYNIAP